MWRIDFGSSKKEARRVVRGYCSAISKRWQWHERVVAAELKRSGQIKGIFVRYSWTDLMLV